MNPFKVGDTVVCIEKNNDYIAYGKEYVVTQVDNNLIYIRNEGDRVCGYFYRRFVRRQENNKKLGDTMQYTMHLRHIEDIDEHKLQHDLDGNDMAFIDIAGEQYAWLSKNLRQKARVLNHPLHHTRVRALATLYFVGALIEDRQEFMSHLRDLYRLPWDQSSEEVRVDIVNLG